MAPYPYVSVPPSDSDEISTHGLGWTSDSTFNKIPQKWRVDSGHRGLDALSEFSIYFLLVAGFVVAMFLAVRQRKGQERTLGALLGALYYILAVASGSSVSGADSGLDLRFAIIVLVTLSIEATILQLKEAFDRVAAKMKTRSDRMDNG